jgi:hypothetical protein
MWNVAVMPLFKILCNFHVENLRETENLIHDEQFSDRICTGNS